MKARDLHGMVFGELTVIGKGGGIFYGKKRRVKKTTWICKCSCGKIKEQATHNLTKSSSCGCKFKRSIKCNFVDLVGKKFGYLYVVRKSDEKTKCRGAKWVCLCDCGNTTELSSNALTSGNTITCGKKSNHYKNELDPKFKRIGEIPLTLLKTMQSSASGRNLAYKVTGEYLWDLFLKQNRKCALSGRDICFTSERNATRSSKLTTASLDRIDSNGDYSEGNVRWVHKHVNIARGPHNDNVFLSICRDCYLHSINYTSSKDESGSKTMTRDNKFWDRYFLRLAREVSSCSKDPSTKVGALIVGPNREPISWGYNGFPMGVDDDEDRYKNRDIKVQMVSHAEINAIVLAKRDLKNCVLYTYPFMSCSNCAGCVINAGITRCVAPPVTKELEERWGKNLEVSKQMFFEAGVKLDIIEFE